MRERMETKKDNQLECHTCAKSFPTKQRLKRHVMSHGELAKCEICGKILKNIACMDEHIRCQHTAHLQHSCRICDQAYSTRFKLQKHLSSSHNVEMEIPRYPCTFPGCGKTYLAQKHALYHFKLEHAENHVLFGCTLCEKYFKTKQRLDIHISSHTTERSYKCVQCGRSFTQLSCLRSHEKTHLDKSARPSFKCPLCPGTFNRKKSMQRHVEDCHENHEYPCKSCDTVETTAARLRHHVLTNHSENKNPPHSCDQCGYQSWRKDGLTKHYRRVHQGLKGYECYFCCKKFFNFSDLASHLRRIHTLEK